MIDFGQQIADAEREFKHGNTTVAFGRLASVCAHMLGRLDALEAEVERSRADTLPSINAADLPRGPTLPRYPVRDTPQA